MNARRSDDARFVLRARLDLNLSQQQFADLLGWSRGRVAHLELDRGLLRASEVRDVVRVSIRPCPCCGGVSGQQMARRLRRLADALEG